VTSLATLYVVATPLGHLGDLSPRAAEILRSVGVVAAEDTRRTRQLLTHLGASPRLISYHAHSDPDRLDTLLAILAEGRDVALVSDAGTPGISDPGAALVRAVWDGGGRVIPVPGPSAVATALSAAGFGADRFLFLGFVPRKGPDRQRLLRIVAESEWTVVLFEAANRVVDLLTDLVALAGPDRQGAVARELTKMYEEIRRGTLEELAGHYAAAEPRGEVTLVIEGVPRRDEGTSADELAAGRTLAARLLEEGTTAKDAVRILVAQLGLPRNTAYQLVMEAR
jgi:16S rRNA (cytidine1402-2'-O)-methyltransferase